MVTKVGRETFLSKTSWRPAADLHLTNTGKYLGFESDELGYITIVGPTGFPKYYQVSRVMLRAPSEHQVNGQRFAAELQVVHKSQKSVLELDDQDVLITSFLFEVGAESKLLKQLLGAPVPSIGESVTIHGGVDLMWAFGPALSGHFFKYDGTHSSSPEVCGQRVQWVVFQTPLTLSSQQLQALSAGCPSTAATLRSSSGHVVVQDTMEEAEVAAFRFFISRDTGVNPERRPAWMIVAPIIGTVLLWTAVMCSVFVREDPHRKLNSAGGLEHVEVAQLGTV